MMYSKNNDHSLVLNKSGNTMIIWLKVMFELSLDLHGQCYSSSDNHPWVIENKENFYSNHFQADIMSVRTRRCIFDTP